MKTPLFLALFLTPSLIMAQQIHVEKVKGNKAIVEISGGSLTPGKSYNLGGSGGSASGGASGGGSRQYVAAGSFVFHSGTDSTSISSGSVSATSSGSGSDLNLLMRFGWNFEQYEAGPIFSYRNVDSDYQALHYSSIGGGGFADYNFNPNRAGESTVFCVTGEGTYGTYTPKNGTGGNGLAFFLGASLKWFGFTNSTALRTDLGYDYQKITISSSSITSSGLTLRAGIATYF